MRRPISFTAVALALALVPLAPRTASALGDEDRRARVLGQQGQEALNRGDYKTAADRFTKADALHHDPSMLLGLARAQVGAGTLATARGTYQRIMNEDLPRGSKILESATHELDAIAPHLAWITIELQGADNARVLLDDVEVPASALGQVQAIDPGRHIVRVKGDGINASESFIVTSGEERIVKLTLDPTPAEAPAPPAAEPSNPPAQPAPVVETGSWQKTIGVVSMAVGGTGILAGAILGGMAAHNESVLEGDCPQKGCPPPSHGTLDTYRQLGAASTISFVAGGTLLGLGVVLFATAPSAVEPERPVARITPFVGVGRAGVLGRF